MPAHLHPCTTNFHTVLKKKIYVGLFRFPRFALLGREQLTGRYVTRLVFRLIAGMTSVTFKMQGAEDDGLSPMWCFYCSPRNADIQTKVSREPNRLKRLTISLSVKQIAVLFLGPGVGLLMSLPPAFSSASPSSLPPHQWPLCCPWALLIIQKNRDGDHLIDCHWLNYCPWVVCLGDLALTLGGLCLFLFTTLPSLVYS